MGRETDALTYLAELARAPHRHDFYQALRRFECLYDDRPRWGRALRPIDEPIRLGQEPHLSFAPTPIAGLETRDGQPPRLLVRLFGMFGPNGPLPLHLTEYARERQSHVGDATLRRFLDIFHHRFLALFYRAWAQAQPHVHRDRPKDDRFTVYIGSFIGVAPPPLRERDAIVDVAKFFHVGALIRQVRNADGLKQILAHYFRVPVHIEEAVGHWMRLERNQRTELGSAWAVVGRGAVLGRSVWDRQHKFRVHLGPLTYEQYESFLPGGGRLRELVDWVRLYLCYELDWDVRLQLQANEVPRIQLGRTHRLGWTTWVGRRPARTPADDLCLDAEAYTVQGARAA